MLVFHELSKCGFFLGLLAQNAACTTLKGVVWVGRYGSDSFRYDLEASNSFYECGAVVSIYWEYLVCASKAVEIRLKAPLQLSGHQHLQVGTLLTAELLEVCQRECDRKEIEALFDIPYTDSEYPLHSELLSFLEFIPGLKDLYDPVAHTHLLKLGVLTLTQYPSLVFRLSLLKASIPFEYQRTLFCLWLVILESCETNRSDEAFGELFLCALAHDLGLLDIHPECIRDNYDPRSAGVDEYEFYSHTSFSAELLNRNENVPKRVLIGIEQHHESMDGTGYPKGKSGNQLGEWGQYIHLFDTLFSIYMNNFRSSGKRLSDLAPIIEINAVTHFGQCANSLLTVLKKAPRTHSVFFKKGEFNHICKEVEAMSAFIEQAIGIIQLFTSNVGFRHEDKVLFMLQNSFIHIALAYYKLSQIDQGGKSYTELDADEYLVASRIIEDKLFTLRELIFHVNKFLYRLRLYRNKHAQGPIATRVDEVIELLSSLTVKLTGGVLEKNTSL